MYVVVVQLSHQVFFNNPAPGYSGSVRLDGGVSLDIDVDGLVRWIWRVRTRADE